MIKYILIYNYMTVTVINIQNICINCGNQKCLIHISETQFILILFKRLFYSLYFIIKENINIKIQIQNTIKYLSINAFDTYIEQYITIQF